ncbi:PTS ascorbate transporter subunit IIA [Spiroplasma clarkii]|uniref:Ascorbate-specific PTS system EIIA component n=1 Tax=Spiroplasma clarkii TaxID=2139 RepID=A0A1Y0L1G2_9MOLU|nr:PTS sugar transporter subunit IIA [Spiroplasma clarkii]ARU91852.1 PTS ascorbate transporter subunit IIA [Spiroplasma clarkii]ATX71205.1 PTS system, ascorbate-specific IIA component [Spiroplasma clarkii]
MDKQFCKIINKTMSWAEAIKASAQTLLEENYFNENYVIEMIENVKKFGSYIVIAPKIALPHASYSKNVFKGGFSITIFPLGIDFQASSGPVYILVTISSTNNEEHLQRLKEISSKLSNQAVVTSLLEAQSSEIVWEKWNEVT